MNILYHSAAPWLHTGYATCTEEIVPRLQREGHNLAIQCLQSVSQGEIMWNGFESDAQIDEPIKVYPSNSTFALNEVKDHFLDFDADILFTHWDTWMDPARRKIPSLNIPYSSYVIVDHEPAPQAVVEQVSEAQETIAMSQYAKHKLEQKGVRPRVIEHGIDTEQYYPLSDDESPDSIEIKDDNNNVRIVDVEDKFIFGMVAANFGSRKNIPNHMHAFKKFIEHVDDEALMMIHTDQKSEKGYNLKQVQKEIGIPDSNLIWPRGEDYGDVDNEYLNALYNSFDVFLNCSFGESWGLTITEAQAAGTPAIATEFTSMPEQLGVNQPNMENTEELQDFKIAPHGILCETSAPFWKTKVNARHHIVGPDNIFSAMKFYYSNDQIREEHGEEASKYVRNNYSWEDNILPKFTKYFEEMEEILT